MSHVRIRTVLCALAALSGSLPAQEISTVGAERETGAVSSWRLAYDNDFFAATDRYFTQGIVVEVIAPGLARLPWNRLLLAPRGGASRFGLAFEDDGYTPSDLKASRILVGDHPYAGTKQLRAFSLGVDSVRQRRISSSLTIGIIGQGAGGAEIQTFIHERTGNTIPQGWHNQIRNDVILNYEAGIERRLVASGENLLLTGTAVGRIGTFNTAATAGATLMVGRVKTPVTIGVRTGRSVYAYARSQLQIVGYDATLQGGLFNRSSPYTIASRDLARIVYRQHVGVVYRSDRWYVEYYRSLNTREFGSGRTHRSGGLLIGVLAGR